MRKTTMFIAFSALTLLPATVSAQGQGAQASVEATASVIQQLEATGQLDLRFGDVIPGVQRTVAPGSGDGGRFLVQGGGNAEVQIQFDLPTGGVLEHESSSSTLPISFNADAAGYGPNAGTVAGTFNPASTFDTDLQSGQLYVFIGGTVDPATGQEEGNYSAQITMNVAYTGS